MKPIGRLDTMDTPNETFRESYKEAKSKNANMSQRPADEEDDGPLSEDPREYIGVINTSGEHLRNLIDDVLDLCALETGQLKLARRPPSIFDYTAEDIEFVNYQHHSAIKAPVAI